MRPSGSRRTASISRRQRSISSRWSKRMWLLDHATRARGYTCPWNMQPTSPSLSTSRRREPSLPALCRGTTTRCQASRFTQDEAVRVATASIYIQKAAIHKLERVQAYVAPRTCNCGNCAPCMLWKEYLPSVALALWRDKGERLYMPMEHAAYLAKPDYISSTRTLPPSTAPRYDDPLSRHRLSFLNGGGGSGKTTRAIELFRQWNSLVFTPTHRLAKEMRTWGVQAQTYHIFFPWSGQTEWTPERMGQKFIPCVNIWDEVCTVPRPTLETFLDWLEGRGVQVICCGDQGQPPPIAGEMPHDWLSKHANYYEEVYNIAKEPFSRPSKNGSACNLIRSSVEIYIRPSLVASGGNAS